MSAEGLFYLPVCMQHVLSTTCQPLEEFVIPQTGLLSAVVALMDSIPPAGNPRAALQGKESGKASPVRGVLQACFLSYSM